MTVSYTHLDVYKRQEDGVVLSSESNRILVKETSGKVHEYKLTKFSRSNQSNCYNQRPIVFKGDEVKAGDVIADGPSTSNGEIEMCIRDRVCSSHLLRL